MQCTSIYLNNKYILCRQLYNDRHDKLLDHFLITKCSYICTFRISSVTKYLYNSYLCVGRYRNLLTAQGTVVLTEVLIMPEPHINALHMTMSTPIKSRI